MNIKLFKIKELAEERKILWKDVCIGSNIPQRTLNQQIHNNNIDLERYIRICRFFNVPFDYFYNGTGKSSDGVNTPSDALSKNSTNQEKCEKCEEKERTIKVQSEMISMQKDMIGMLQNDNKKLKRENEVLTLTMHK